MSKYTSVHKYGDALSDALESIQFVESPDPVFATARAKVVRDIEALIKMYNLLK